MDWPRERGGDRLVLFAPGVLITDNRKELLRQALEEIEHGARHVVINFAGTGYIDSSGLSALLVLQKKLRGLDGDLLLTNLNDDLRTLLSLTKLDTILRVSDERNDEDGGAGRPAVLPLSPIDLLRGATESELRE